MTLAAKTQMVIERLVATVNSPLPPGTTVREVWVSNPSVAYVDFGAELPLAMSKGSLAELYAVYGGVGTLMSSFRQIHTVQFLDDGNGIDTLTGHVDLASPIAPQRDWLY